MEDLAAEHYRRLTCEKTRDALARLRNQGRRVPGGLPYGYRLSSDGRSLDLDPTEQAALVTIRRLARGRTIGTPAQELARRGINASLLEAVAVRYEKGRVDVIDSASRSVLIDGPDGMRRSLRYDRLVLAAGSLGAKPDIPGLAKYGCA